MFERPRLRNHSERVGAAVSDRKANSNAWYAGLSESEQHVCYETMRSLGYVKARLVISEEFGESPSLGAMSAAYQRWSAQEQEAQLLRAAVDIEGIENMTEKLGEVDDALRQRLNQAALSALVGGDPDQIKLLVKLALDARNSEREDAKLKIKINELEDQKAAAKAALEKASKAAKGGGLSPEAIAEIEQAASIL